MKMVKNHVRLMFLPLASSRVKQEDLQPSNNQSNQKILLRLALIEVKINRVQCFMQRPVHPSYGRVKQNVDGCLLVWTGKKILMYHGLQYVGLLRALYRALYMSCYCHII